MLTPLGLSAFTICFHCRHLAPLQHGSLVSGGVDLALVSAVCSRAQGGGVQNDGGAAVTAAAAAAPLLTSTWVRLVTKTTRTTRRVPQIKVLTLSRKVASV
jgi:hypothetical protein